MPLPDGYLPREGDIIVLHGKVKYDLADADDLIFVSIRGNNSIAVPLDKVIGLHCRCWNVGDQVTTLLGPEGEVIAVHDDQVWVKVPGRSPPMTFHANLLKPVPKTVVEPIEPAPRPSKLLPVEEQENPL